MQVPSSACSSQVAPAASQGQIKMQICPCLLGTDSEPLSREKAAGINTGSTERAALSLFYTGFFSFCGTWLFGLGLFNGVWGSQGEGAGFGVAQVGLGFVPLGATSAQLQPPSPHLQQHSGVFFKIIMSQLDHSYGKN